MTTTQELFPKSKYEKCQIPRPEKNYEPDEKIIKSLLGDFSILPHASTALLDYKDARHYSLRTNEFLACRWDVYKRNLALTLLRTPFRVLNPSNEHFYNNCVRLMPELNQSLKNPRMKLRCGPGVDDYGQIPVPFEFYLKRGTDEPKPKQAKKKREESRQAQKDSTTSTKDESFSKNDSVNKN